MEATYTESGPGSIRAIPSLPRELILMGSLTETAFHTRRAINWTILAVIGYIVLRIFWSLFITVYLTIFPPKAPPPNHAFGKLPRLMFPAPSASPSAQPIFQLQTIEGSVPAASASANVYFMPKKGSNLLALSTAQAFVKRLGFATTPIPDPANKNVYRFDDPTMQLRHLWYDVVTTNFIIQYDFQRDTGLFLNSKVPSLQEARAEARNLLQTYNLSPDDLKGGEIRVTYYRVADNTLIPVTSQSQADAVRVDFFRPNLASTPVVTDTRSEGPISIVFSGSSNSKKRILLFRYLYWPIDYETVATYSLKTSAQAWQELQAGGGYVLSYPKTSIITIRNVYLAYYDSISPQTYLQPVFVFEGDDGFVAYVPAINSEWME